MLLGNALLALPEEDRVLLSYSFDDTKVEEVQAFIDRLNQFLIDNPTKVDKEKLVKDTVTQIYKSLAESMKGE